MKVMQGKVVHVSDAKTVKVEVSRNWQHPVYKKYVKRTKNYVCGWDGQMALEVGDTVVLKEGRPLSKTKRFSVIEKVQE